MIIRSNVSRWTAAFILKHEELRDTPEEMNATEMAEDASLSSEMDKKENILKSDALKSDRLTFAFQ